MECTHKKDFFSGIMECCTDVAAFVQLRIKNDADMKYSRMLLAQE